MVRAPRRVGWFSVVDHRTIALRYIVTAFGFFGIAGLIAVAMRLQLAVPDNGLIDPIATTSCSPCTAR